ncbi:putative NADPH-dependent beta-ketoacyl reductase [Chytridium lagenaria]|nr:putative NADPH-dependent beta-ketoacyl reductase [Chytridium lagenaria]
MSLNLKLDSLFSVKNKVAVVTGGGSGIGKMIAAALIQNGAKVYIASRKLKNVQDAADELNKMGPGMCIALQADLTTKAEADALATKIMEKEPKIHILVNNSGMSWGGHLTDYNEKDGWDRLFALNVKSLFFLTTALLPALQKDATNIDPGRVVNISSVAGTSAIAEMDLAALEWEPDNASKAAVNHLTRLLANTLAGKRVTVNAIAPGSLLASQPTGRIGTTEDMAGLALFLCSRAASHITGAVIPIDGGQTLGTTAYAKM